MGPVRIIGTYQVNRQQIGQYKEHFDNKETLFLFANEGQFSFQQMTQFVQHLLLINAIDVSQTPHFNKVTDSKDKQVLVFGVTMVKIYQILSTNSITLFHAK
jgi:predicted nucleic acid-binding protein